MGVVEISTGHSSGLHDRAKMGVKPLASRANFEVWADQGVDLRALASVKVTDVMVLVLGLTQWPVGVRMSPAGYEGLPVRAALYSFGFLLRRAAADYLDIHEWELKVGLRVAPDPSGGVVGQIFYPTV